MFNYSTTVLHAQEDYQHYKNLYNPDRVGFTLKLLEMMTRGLTDGQVDAETVNGVVKHVRHWTTEDAANEWKELVLEKHPTGYEVTIAQIA